MNEELAKRAVACKHWRWMPGMLDAVFGRVVAVYEDEIVFADCRVAAFAKVQPDSPDVDDHATIGCLLALVREAWGRRVTFECGPDGEDAYIRIVPPHDERAFGPKFRGSTIAAALVAALEDAP